MKSIIISTPLIPATLDGRKTMTRRVIKPQPRQEGISVRWECRQKDNFGRSRMMPYLGKKELMIPFCPHGQPGDKLWVKETWQVERTDFDEYGGLAQKIFYKADKLPHIQEIVKWCSPYFMPRWASRITLEILNVRVERIQEISPLDCLAEGIPEVEGDGLERLDKFQDLWDSLNAFRGFSFDFNPFVWVISFKRIGC